MSDARTTTEATPRPARPGLSIDLPRWTPWAVIGLVLLGATVLTMRHGLGSALIVVAGLTLVLSIWLAFRAVQTIAEPDDRVVLIDLPPTPAQARKQTAMRALKDLDFEKSLGNLSEADFDELERRYREEAKRAMREVDDERAALRGRAERLARQAIDDAPEEPDEPVSTSAADPTPTPAAAPASIRAREKTVACPECDTKNEPDARFCKQCGAKMEVSS